MRLRSPFSNTILLLIALAAPWLRAQDGIRGALLHSTDASREILSSFGSMLVPADFDNDQKPDGALLRDAGIMGDQRIYRIELHLSAGENRDLTFAANDSALAISALDVNQDGMPDLIVEQAFTHKRIQIWLNDGHGKFRQARVEDFPASPDAPCQWRAPNPTSACLILGLPSRFETNHTAQLLKILRFDSSSSHWRVRGEAPFLTEFISTSGSPRAPPVFLPL